MAGDVRGMVLSKAWLTQSFRPHGMGLSCQLLPTTAKGALVWVELTGSYVRIGGAYRCLTMVDHFRSSS
jgi:hypothetical protein